MGPVLYGGSQAGLPSAVRCESGACAPNHLSVTHSILVAPCVACMRCGIGRCGMCNISHSIVP